MPRIIFNANEYVVQNQRSEIYQGGAGIQYIETNWHHLNKRNFTPQQHAYIALSLNTYNLLRYILLQKTLFSQRKKMPAHVDIFFTFIYFLFSTHTSPRVVLFHQLIVFPLVLKSLGKDRIEIRLHMFSSK